MLTALIANFRQLTRPGKQSYFGRRWGAVAGLNKQVDRRDYQFDEVSNCSPTTTLHQQIISRYQHKDVPGELSQFVRRLRSESLSFVAHQRGLRVSQVERLAALNGSGAATVERIFRFLELCAMELNTALGFSELTIVTTAPCYVSEVVRYSQARQPLEVVVYFRARLGTPTWSLAIRAREDVIEFFLLPTPVVMGLSRMEQQYPPIAVLLAEIEQGAVSWNWEERPLTAARESLLGMLVFKQLFAVTRQQIETESSALLRSAGRPDQSSEASISSAERPASSAVFFSGSGTNSGGS